MSVQFTHFVACMSSFLRYDSVGSLVCGLLRYSATCRAGNSVSQTYPKSRAKCIASPATYIKKKKCLKKTPCHEINKNIIIYYCNIIQILRNFPYSNHSFDNRTIIGPIFFFFTVIKRSHIYNFLNTFSCLEFILCSYDVKFVRCKLL